MVRSGASGRNGRPSPGGDGGNHGGNPRGCQGQRACGRGWGHWTPGLSNCRVAFRHPFADGETEAWRGSQGVYHAWGSVLTRWFYTESAWACQNPSWLHLTTCDNVLQKGHRFCHMYKILAFFSELPHSLSLKYDFTLYDSTRKLYCSIFESQYHLPWDKWKTQSWEKQNGVSKL